jgi:hypothetical protein
MKPGRELDALVAEHIFGAKVNLVPGYGWPIQSPDMLMVRYEYDKESEDTAQDGTGKWVRHEYLPHYSTNISPAWMVVEEFTGPHNGCVISMGGEGLPMITMRRGDGIATVSTDLVPFGICLAALKAVGVACE